MFEDLNIFSVLTYCLPRTERILPGFLMDRLLRSKKKPKASVALILSEELKILYEKGLLGMCIPEGAKNIVICVGEM